MKLTMSQSKMIAGISKEIVKVLVWVIVVGPFIAVKEIKLFLILIFIFAVIFFSIVSVYFIKTDSGRNK